MQQPIEKRSWIQRNASYGILVPMILGLHVGWFLLQQRHVPAHERHDHPLVTLYKKYAT